MALNDLYSTHHQPLLSNNNGVHLSNGGSSVNNSNHQKTASSFFASLAKWVLKFTMWVVFIAWVALFFVIPTGLGATFYDDWLSATSGTLFGETGSALLLYSGPIIFIVILAVPYTIICGQEEEEHKLQQKKTPRFKLWTFPVLVDGPFGIVNAAELIGIILFIVFVIWAAYAYTVVNLELLAEFGEMALPKTCSLFLTISGRSLGKMGMFCLSFLFLPVARGSVLLRLIDIPFEHATRYHVWLGHLTMVIFTIHGLCYVVAWTIQGHIHSIFEWKDTGVAILAGLIGLSAGLLMWVTSLPPVRKLNFELFFYTHQLYIIFIVFFALHIGDFFFTTPSGAIFIFILDRFLRFCQSQRVVDIISTKCLPCGTVELVLAKPQILQYNALSFVFLHVRELSLLQWHPFSVSSSPLDGKCHISVLIKGLGKWTENLRGNILKNSEAEPQIELPYSPHTKITASVEGPYGPVLPYHLMCENLILVAGGIGISPFLAVLSDILHRVREEKPCLPRNILVVWAVKRTNELSLLSTIDMDSICSFFSNKLNFETHIYVTRESEPPLEEGEVQNTIHSCLCPASKRCGMSVLVGSGHNIWFGLYVISSIVGFVIILGLSHVFYITPFNISTSWYRGLLFLVCMVVSVFIFGGLVVGLWHLWERRTSAKQQCEDDRLDFDKAAHTETVAHNGSHQKSLANSTSIQYGARPDFKEILGTVSKNWGHVDVSVIVCGPPTLESSIAKEIRSHNLKRQCDHPIFHFNSHSFAV